MIAETALNSSAEQKHVSPNRRPRNSRFTQSDITKAVRGAILGGIELRSISIELDGKMILHVGDPEKVSKQTSWDDVLT